MHAITAVRMLGLSLTVLFAFSRAAAAQVGVSVTPDGTMTPQRPTNSGPYNADFFVKNTSGSSDVFDIACSGLVNVTCTGVSQSVVSLSPGDSALVTATYTVAGAGTGELDLTAVSQFTFAWDEGYYQVPVVGLPPSNWDVVPLNHDNQAMGRCGAACFAATYAQSTVSYVSLDVPRNVTLVYHGDRVWPKPFVHLNVQKPSGTNPDTIWLQVKKGGVFQPFVNNETLLKFIPATSGWQRIGGQLRDSTWATGMLDVEIVVTWRYASGSPTQQVWATKILVVNEKSSSIARGWTLAGVQRVYQQPDSSLLITEGDGSAVFFRKSGSTFVAPAGEFSTVTINGTGWKRRYTDSTSVYFNNTGRMTDVYDRFNNRTQFLYDPTTNRLTTIRDPNSQDLVLAYGTHGLSSIRDNITPFRYTNISVVSDSTLTAIQDPDGVSTTFQYDGSKRLWKVTDRRGSTTTLAYQTINGKSTGKLTTVTAPAVPIFGEGTVAPVVSYTPWQTIGVPYTATVSSPYALVRPDTVYGRITDPGGHLTRFTVGRWGQPVAQIDVLADTTVTTYDANGLPIRVVYPTGVKDTIGYNASGLPIFVRAAGRDSATYIRYGAWAQPDSVWGYQVPVRNFIGPNGRVDSTLTLGAAGAAVTKYMYDTRGRIERVTDPENHLAGRTWYLGTNGNRSRDSLPGNRQTYYSYDTRGRRTNTSTPGVTPHFMTYDVLNRVLKDSIAGMAPTVYAYDSLFLRTVTDPRGQVYRFAYNALGWTTARIDPANRADTLRYDRDGLLRQWKNRRQQAVTYTYDVGHRITLKFDTNADTTSWGYSADDRVKMAKSPWAVDTVFVSTAGRLDSTRTRLGGQPFTQRFRYTAGGQLDSVEVVGGAITFLARKYLWNAQSGALTTIRLAGGGMTALASNRDELLSSTTLPGGEAIARTYTAVHGEAQVSTAAAYAATVNRYLNFDAAGRIARQIYGSGTAGRAFTYDGLGRLVADSQISYAGPSNPCAEPNIVDENGNLCTYEGTWNTVPSGSITYSYDAVGNRTDQGGTYGSANRIRQFAGCTYVTDSLGDGNVLSRTCGSETVLFTWSAESRLTRLVVGIDTFDFRYDASGRLVRQKRSGAAARFLLWQGDNLLAEIDSVTGKVAEYSYYPGLDQPHAVITATTPHFAHLDGIGNVIALTDSAKSVKRDYDFDAWGGLRSGTDYKPFSNADRARFKGALWLGPQVDVYYMRARWYEPKAGRFLSEDPTGLAGGINSYNFAENDPVNRRDPTGLVPCGAGEELWMLFWDNDHNGEYSAGDDIIRVWCKNVGGGGGGSGTGQGQGQQQLTCDVLKQPPFSTGILDVWSRGQRFGEFRAWVTGSNRPVEVFGWITKGKGGVLGYVPDPAIGWPYEVTPGPRPALAIWGIHPHFYGNNRPSVSVDLSADSAAGVGTIVPTPDSVFVRPLGEGLMACPRPAASVP